MAGCVLGLPAGSVRAQLDSERLADDSAEAVRLFREAETAWTERRLYDAVDLLQHSLDLDPHAPTAFNLATVLHEIGRVQAAVQMLEELRSGRYECCDEALRQAVDTRYETARNDVATIRLQGHGPERASIRVDGNLVGTLDAASPIEVPGDPGEHFLAVEPHFAGPVVERTLTLRRGQIEAIDIELRAVPPASIASEESGEATASNTLAANNALAADNDDETIVESPVFWTVVAGVVLAGVATTIGVWLATEEPDTVVDPYFGNVSVLRAAF